MKTFKLITCLAALILPFTTFAQSNIKPVANHQAICVKDMPASIKFYSEVMQLDSLTTPFNSPTFKWFKTGPATELHLIKGDCNGVHFQNVHMAFAVPSIEAFTQHLDKLNVKYSSSSGAKKTQTRPDGILQIYLEDPDGYWIEVNNVK